MPSREPPSAATTAPSVARPASGNALACAEIASLKQINDEFDQVAANLPKARSLMVGLRTTAHRLTIVAPAAIRTNALTYDDSVLVLASVVNKVHSIKQLQSQAVADPKLKAALTDLASSGAALSTWRTSNC
jgi:hypothetical protein